MPSSLFCLAFLIYFTKRLSGNAFCFIAEVKHRDQTIELNNVKQFFLTQA